MLVLHCQCILFHKLNMIVCSNTVLKLGLNNGAPCPFSHLRHSNVLFIILIQSSERNWNSFLWKKYAILKLSSALQFSLIKPGTRMPKYSSWSMCATVFLWHLTYWPPKTFFEDLYNYMIFYLHNIFTWKCCNIGVMMEVSCTPEMVSTKSNCLYSVQLTLY